MHDAIADHAEPGDSPTLDWIVHTRNYWGDIVGDTGSRLDGFFADEYQIEQTNSSYLKLSLQGVQYKGGSSYLYPKIKFRLDLPVTKRKFDIVFESESPESESLEDKQLSQGPNRETESIENTATGAIQFLVKQKEHWDVSMQTGVKLRLPLDPFWRTKANYSYNLNDDWRVSSNDSIYYFNSDGWGAGSNLRFERKGSWAVFRQTTDGRYTHTERRWEISHVYSFIREISPIRAINYEIGAFMQTKPDVEATGYFIHAIYRRKVYADWLFYELTPEVYYPKEDNWKFSPSISAKIEIVFSAKK